MDDGSRTRRAGDYPSTGYFVLFLCVVLVLSGLFVMGVIPWFGS